VKPVVAAAAAAAAAGISRQFVDRRAAISALVQLATQFDDVRKTIAARTAPPVERTTFAPPRGGQYTPAGPI